MNFSPSRNNLRLNVDLRKKRPFYPLCERHSLGNLLKTKQRLKEVDPLRRQTRAFVDVLDVL